MIKRSGFKPVSFLSAIACTIAASEHARVDEESIPKAGAADHVIYLASGYWRGELIFDDAGNLDGIRLLDPDRSPEEIRAVERGIALLRRLDFV